MRIASAEPGVLMEPSRFPRGQSVQTWLDVVLGEGPPDPWRRLRRLLPMVDASMDAADRLALHRCLWSVWKDTPASVRAQAAALLDGRYRLLCDWMDLDWAHPQTRQRLAAVHLQPHSGWPQAPDYVLALLDQPDAQGEMTPAQQGWWRCLAHLRLAPWAIDLVQAEIWSTWVADATAQECVMWSAGMSVMFEILVRAGQHGPATDILAECIAAGRADVIAVEPLCCWLEGEHPLRLGARWQSAWLKPGSVGHAAWRARLRTSVHRASVISRLDHLESQLAARGAGHDGGEPESLHDAWRLLAMLDRCYVLALSGCLPSQAIELLMAPGQLAPASVAGLWHVFAHQCMQSGQAIAALSALARARSARSDEEVRQTLAQLLALVVEEMPATAAPALRQVIDQLEQGSQGGAQSAEAHAWCALNRGLIPGHWLKSAVQAMCARLAADGALEPAATDRQRDLSSAGRLWKELRSDEVHADEAARYLASEPLQDWLPWLRTARGVRSHLWIDSRHEGSSNDELLIVFSCLESRHGFANFRGLAGKMKGKSLLFVNNPEFDWYSGGTFDDVVGLIQSEVFPRFPVEKVCCYFGSMGGYGALALARYFGFRAIVFNPQVDLDLWAAFRPVERERLWRASALGAGCAVMSPWPSASLCLMVGSGTADREALSALIPGLAACCHGSFIIRKFPDAVHAGLIGRVVHEPIADFLERTMARLTRLARLGEALSDCADECSLTPVEDVDALWRQIDESDCLQVEIISRAGRVFFGPA
ncbi:MAG: hypothetical protein QG638_171 [Pseudomonadota bacterium]|nr:hypothetical protein [Pseudomonadota bacterium]